MRILLYLVLPVLGCTFTPGTPIDPTRELTQAKVRPGLMVLLTDSIGLIKEKRLGLLTNQAGVDSKGVSALDLLGAKNGQVAEAQARLVAIFAPEHGLRASEDRTNLKGGIDKATGVPIYSLYGAMTIPPPDSAMQKLDVLIIDLQDIGTRTWTYEGAMVYALRAAARNKKKVLVLDRPNPLTGAVVEGPMLDSSLANSADPAPGKPGLAYALFPIPLRHGMTMGELARFYNDTLKIQADLTVIPMQGWKRDVWFDRTGLPWIAPSPAMQSFRSAMLYPALVAFEGTNLSVGRGTVNAFQRLGAPWLKPDAVIKLLQDYGVKGVKFTSEPFIPVDPGDSKYNRQKIPGITITVTNRSMLNSARLSAALLWAINKTSPNDLKVNNKSFDLLFGSPSAREALMRGEDPDAVIDRQYKAVYDFRNAVRKYFIYK